MTRGRRGLLGAVTMGVVASLALYWYLVGLEPRYPVVVAAADLEPGTPIGSGKVRVSYVPRADVNPLAVTTLEGAVGRFPRESIYPGEQLLGPRLATAEEVGATARLPDHELAMFLALPLEQLGGGTVRPGGEVNVVFVHDGRERPSHAQVVLQGLKVLEVRDDRGRAWSEGKGAPAGVVLAVTAQEAEVLAFCREHGTLYLALRHPGAVAQYTPGVGWEALYQYGALGKEASVPGGQAAGQSSPPPGQGSEGW